MSKVQFKFIHKIGIVGGIAFSVWFWSSPITYQTTRQRKEYQKKLDDVYWNSLLRTHECSKAKRFR